MKNVKSLVIYINTKFEVNLNSLFTANQDLNSCPKKKRYPSSQECLRLRRLGVKQGLFKRSDDGDDNENVKESKRFNKQNNFARASRFFVHFFAITARLRRENVYFHFLQRKYTIKRRRNFLLLFELGYGSQEFNFQEGSPLTKLVTWSNRDED